MKRKFLAFTLIAISSVSLMGCGLTDKILNKDTPQTGIVQEDERGIDSELKQEISGVKGTDFIGEWITSNDEYIIFKKNADVEIYDNINKEGTPQSGTWKLVESTHFSDKGIKNVPEIVISTNAGTKSLVIGVYDKVCAELLNPADSSVIGIARSAEDIPFERVFDVADIKDFPDTDKFQTSKANASEEELK